MKRCKLKKTIDPTTLENVAKYIQEHFELNTQGKIVPKVKGLDVIIIDHLNLL